MACGLAGWGMVRVIERRGSCGVSCMRPARKPEVGLYGLSTSRISLASATGWVGSAETLGGDRRGSCASLTPSLVQRLRFQQSILDFTYTLRDSDHVYCALHIGSCGTSDKGWWYNDPLTSNRATVPTPLWVCPGPISSALLTQPLLATWYSVVSAASIPDISMTPISH